MKRIVTIEFPGGQREIAFTVGAMEKLEEMAGGEIENLDAWLAESSVKTLSRTIEVLHVLMEEGELAARLRAEYAESDRKPLPIPTTEQLKTMYGVNDMRELLLGLKSDGKTMIVASHNSADIDILCDRVFEIEKGNLKQVR